MCHDVYVTRFGKQQRAHTIGELHALIGVRPKIERGARSVKQMPRAEQDRFCLCCVSLHKTAQRAGMRLYHSGPMASDMVSR